MKAASLRFEREVLLDAVLAANGQIRIVKVVQSLGQWLDKSATRAAEKIQFKLAVNDGHPGGVADRIPTCIVAESPEK